MTELELARMNADRGRIEGSVWIRWLPVCAVAVAVIGLLGSSAGCASKRGTTAASDALPLNSLQPSNDRAWRPELAVLPTADIKRDRVRIHNIRNCTFTSEDDVKVDHYDRTFDLDKLQGVDFIVVPFKEAASLAHTMVSFDFADQGHVVASIEARMEQGEVYSPIGGALRQYELMYVIADERDVIRLRTGARDVDVFLYRTNASPEQSRELFVDMMKRANVLAKSPEFYDSLSNNCTTNLARHVNHIRPNRVPLNDLRLLLPGYSDRLAYDLGLIDNRRPFDEVRREAQINYLARVYADDSDFSKRIRRR